MTGIPPQLSLGTRPFLPSFYLNFEYNMEELEIWVFTKIINIQYLITSFSVFIFFLQMYFNFKMYCRKSKNKISKKPTQSSSLRPSWHQILFLFSVLLFYSDTPTTNILDYFIFSKNVPKQALIVVVIITIAFKTKCLTALTKIFLNFIILFKINYFNSANICKFLYSIIFNNTTFYRNELNMTGITPTMATKTFDTNFFLHFESNAKEKEIWFLEKI
jgi:hypothetical protein